MKLYVILLDRSDDLGEGYTDDSFNEFIACRRTFDEARELMTLIADESLGGANDEVRSVFDEDWDYIEMDGTEDYYGYGYEKLHIKEIEV